MYTYPANVFAAIRQERNDFLNNFIEIVPGYTFNQYLTIKKIHKYYNSHYELGDYENVNGIQRKKVFFNINKWRCDVSTKMLDVDVKDFLLVSENPETELNCYLLEKELKYWLKKHKLGKVLNEVTRKLPVYGSVVLKKVKNGAEVCDLRYLFVDQAAATLEASRYIIQKHLMTPVELRAMSGVWNNVEDVIARYCAFATTSYEGSGQWMMAVGSPYAEVYERWAEVPLSWFTKKESDEHIYTLSHFIVAGVDDSKQNEKGQDYFDNGLVLFKEQIKELPFKEVHYQKTEGRWLGIGVVEDVFEDQRRVNQIRDQESKAMELSSLILLQTKDDLIAKNLISDVENGDIMRVRSNLERVDMTNTASVEFQNVSNAYETHADRMTFSYDVIRGETVPTSATATAVINQAQQASSVFDYKRENIGLFLQEFVTDLVFPEIARKINTPHIFRFTGTISEVEKLKEKAVEAYLRERMLSSGDIPTQAEHDAMKARLMADYSKQGNKMWIDIEEDFYKNLDYEVSLEITGEGKNIQTQLTNLGIVLGELAKNPQLLDNPVLKRVFFKQMSLMGMSGSELELAESDMNQQQSSMQMQQPVPGQPPMMMTQPNTPQQVNPQA